MTDSNVTPISEGRRRFESERPLGSVVNDLKTEAKAFAQTRMAMLQSELRDKMAVLKAAIPAIAVGAVFALTAWLVLTGALIAIVATAFGNNPFSVFLAFLIVGVAYLLIGGLALLFGIRSLSGKNLVPTRTIQVLKDDKVWLQNEAKTQV